MSTNSIDLNFFSDIQQSLENESDRKDEIRTKVREFERISRKLVAILNMIHANPMGPVPEISFQEIRERVQQLAALIPEDQFYKYNDLWSRSMQQAVFLVVFKHYLETEQLVDIKKIEETIGVKVDLDNSLNEFHIQLEEVLHAYISLVNELSRLAVNSVTVGDYDRPLRLSKFVKDLSAGFQLLNLKNDMLRKRFDGIKYDVKKIEEVVYDISLRGLQKNKNRNEDTEEDSSNTAKKPKLAHGA
ncbi:Translin [Phascolomyces articulosus]|uniref:Translin n=1 Tax=Phascolomyces articulosus TaxID=60185 RepID=A0AAD5K2Q8_9FUNG|nr:Translin [Phascolomyces articulosus]